MIKLKSLINEDISEKDFSKMFFYAYSTIFDIDMSDIEYFHQAFLMPPSYIHLYYFIQLRITYKMEKYCLYNKFYYYKFPKEELKGLSREEWNNVLKTSEKFPSQTIDKNSIKTRNPLFDFSVAIIKGEDFLHGEDLGTGKDFNNIYDLVNEAKRIIDKHDSSGPNDEVPSPITPKNTKLVTV